MIEKESMADIREKKLNEIANQAYVQGADMELRFSMNSIALQIVGNPEIEYFIKFEMKGLNTIIRIEDNSDTQVDFSVDSFVIKNGQNAEYQEK